MKLAIISARKLYRYVLSTLKQHPEKHGSAAHTRNRACISDYSELL